MNPLVIHEDCSSLEGPRGWGDTHFLEVGVQEVVLPSQSRIFELMRSQPLQKKRAMGESSMVWGCNQSPKAMFGERREGTNFS